MSSSGIVGPFSPKKKFHWKEGKETLEESIHNVKPLDLCMAHLNDDNSSVESSEGSIEEVIEVEETSHVSDDDASSYEEVERVVEEEVEVDDESEGGYEDEEEEEEEEDEASTNSKTESNNQEMDLQSENEQYERSSCGSPMNITTSVVTVSPLSPLQSQAKQKYCNDHDEADYDNDEDSDKKDISWKKPEWTKSPVLKTTAKGKIVKDGETLSVPITKIADVVANEKKDLSFKKPDWMGTHKLKATGKGEVLKNEGNLAKPITSLPHMNKNFDKEEKTILEQSHDQVQEQQQQRYQHSTTQQRQHKEPPSPSVSRNDDNGTKSIEWAKPDWTKKQVLKETAKGEKLKSGEAIGRPIGGIKPIDD